MAQEFVVLEIRDIALGGCGIGKLDEFIYFVSGAITGEVVRVKVFKEKENRKFAKIVEIIKPSPHRINPSCPLAIQVEDNKLLSRVSCPGCSYQHLDYDYEVEIKNNQFIETINRLGGIDVSNIIQPPIKSPKDLYYRNKITFHIEHLEHGEMNFGYRLSDNESVIEVGKCHIANPAINDILAEQKQKKNFKQTLKNKNISVTYRHTENSGAEFWRNNPNSKDSWLKESTKLGNISVPKESFFQINPLVGDILISKVEEYVKKANPEILIDLYCGVGIFAITAALQNVPKVIGVDIDKNAITVAKFNAKSRDLKNCAFRKSDAGKIARDIFSDIKTDNSMLIIDPPRGGLSRRSRESIIKSNIKTIIYISCSPDTLARDLKELTSNGYELKETQLLDMFPRTAHFETISYLEK